MKQFDKAERVCPKCGRTYTELSAVASVNQPALTRCVKSPLETRMPALSRIDNKTDICPECGCWEALEVVGLSKDEIEKTIAVMRNHQKI